MSYSIPTCTMTGTFSFIWEHDPALDRECTDEQGSPDFDNRYRLYVETGDEKHLAFKSGMEPTRWQLRYLSSKEIRRAQGAMHAEGPTMLSYAAAAMAIEAVSGRGDDGKPVKIGKVSDGHGYRICNPALLDALDKSAETAGLVDAIGLTALARSNLTPK